MRLDPESAPGGTVVPKQEYAYPMRLFRAKSRPGVRHIFEKFPGGSLLMSPSSYKDFLNPDLQPAPQKILPRCTPPRCRTDQTLQAHRGRDRHEIRRPPRTPRDRLFRQ